LLTAPVDEQAERINSEGVQGFIAKSSAVKLTVIAASRASFALANGSVMFVVSAGKVKGAFALWPGRVAVDNQAGLNIVGYNCASADYCACADCYACEDYSACAYACTVLQYNWFVASCRVSCRVPLTAQDSAGAYVATPADSRAFV
jgi:hypothetical protein